MARVNFKGIETAKEPELLPDAVHQLRVVKAEYGPGKDPSKMRTQVIIDCPERPDCRSIFHYLSEPSTEDDYLRNNQGKTREDWIQAEEFKKLSTKRFLLCFDIPYDEEGYDTENFVGHTGSCGVTTDLINENDPNSKTSKLILPELGV